jgi:hypothetical protein
MLIDEGKHNTKKAIAIIRVENDVTGLNEFLCI